MKKIICILFVCFLCFTPVSAKENKYNFISGDVDTVGSEVCFGAECFYIIANDGEMLSLLSKYNLLVGNQYNISDDIVTPLVNPSGIQDASAIGYFRGNSATNPLIGTIPFSNEVYWSSEEYPKYVFDDNSNLYNYIESYREFLISLGVSVKTSRLISYDELIALGCNLKNNECSRAPKWVYATTYWTGAAGTDDKVWNVISNGYAYSDLYNCNRRGVRPVIEIPVGWFYSSNDVYVGNIHSNDVNDKVTYSDNSIEVQYTDLEEYNTYSVMVYNDSSHAMYINDVEVNTVFDSVVECELDNASINKRIEAYSSEEITFHLKKVEHDVSEEIAESVKVSLVISDGILNPETNINIRDVIFILFLVFGIFIIGGRPIHAKKR